MHCKLHLKEKLLHTQYFVQNKRLDFYFSEHKLGVEVDEYGLADREFEYEQSRQLTIKKKLVVKLLELIQAQQILTFTH